MPGKAQSTHTFSPPFLFLFICICLFLRSFCEIQARDIPHCCLFFCALFFFVMKSHVFFRTGGLCRRVRARAQFLFLIRIPIPIPILGPRFEWPLALLLGRKHEIYVFFELFLPLPTVVLGFRLHFSFIFIFIHFSIICCNWFCLHFFGLN